MEETILDINVSPKSSRSTIIVSEDSSVKVYLQSPPVDGKANKECVALFSKKLKIPKSSILIRKGEKGKKKQLLIEGIGYEELIAKLKV